MKKTQIATIVLCTMVMIVGFWLHAQGSTPVQRPILNNAGHPLRFAPVAVEPLLVATPGSSLSRARTIELSDVGEQGKVWVHLYRYATDLNSKNVIGFLTDGEKVYSLGTLSIRGEQNVTASTIDCNHDGVNDIRITGSFDNTIFMTQIFTPGPEGGWRKLLAATNVAFYDLNQDGDDEIVALSSEKDSPSVRIFRWQQDHFEKADVAGSTGSVYATLIAQGTSVAIEAGKQIDTEIEPVIYHYDDGKLYNLNDSAFDIN